jgi:hypothetical protein
MGFLNLFSSLERPIRRNIDHTILFSRRIWNQFIIVIEETPTRMFFVLFCFQIQFASRRLSNCLFKVEDGNVKVVESPFANLTGKHSRTMRPPTSGMFQQNVSKSERKVKVFPSRDYE